MVDSNDSRKPLDFEIPIFEMEAKVAELEELATNTGMNLNGQLLPLKSKLAELTQGIFADLTPWQRVKVARHPHRPYTTDYIEFAAENFVEIHGDRRFRDDHAIVCGFATIGGHRCVLIGHRKGRNFKEKIACNFGCAHPEGYRKAQRAMRLAEKFQLPIVTLINTPGAYPGVGAEERGQAFAIAENLMLMAGLRTPIVCVVIGEGGSGGALGIGIGDRILMLENAYYSVISPEGCAAILWKSADHAERAASALKLTSSDLIGLGVIDEIVREPLGGGHRNPEQMVETVRDVIVAELEALKKRPIEELLDARYEKFRAMGTLFSDEPWHPATADVPETAREVSAALDPDAEAAEKPANE